MKKKFNILALAVICALGTVISSCGSNADEVNQGHDDDGDLIFDIPNTGSGSDSTDDNGGDNDDNLPGDNNEQTPEFDISTTYGQFQKFVYENGGDVTELDLTQYTDQFSIANLLEVAYHEFSYVNENSTFYSFSKATSSVTFVITLTNNQITGTAWYKRGDKILKENTSENNLSSASVRFTDRTYNYDVANNASSIYDDQYDTYRMSLSGSRNFNSKLTYSVDYSNATTKDSRTLEEYKENFYLDPNYCSNYLFYDETIDTETTVSATSVLNSNNTYSYKTSIGLSNDTYTIQVVLNSYAYARYRRYMVTTTKDQSLLAQQKDLPDFEYVAIEFKLDRELKLQSAVVSEKYVVHAASDATTSAESVYLFDYDDNSSIPGLTTMVDFASMFSSYL